MSIDWLNILRDSLKPAAETIMKIYFSDQRNIEISRGYGGDMTLIADKRSEDIIIENLRKISVDIKVISEETGEVIIGKMPQYTVMLDPLDGSFNFKQGLFYFGISIAVLDNNASPVAAFIMDIPQGAEYYASHEGAFKNGIKLKTLKKDRVGNLLLEFAKNHNPEDLKFILKTVSKMKKVRAPGAVALDLCAVAEGSFDCLLSTGSSRYLDIAAGRYILEQAGGVVTDFKGNPDILDGIQLKAENLLAAVNIDIHKYILA